FRAMREVTGSSGYTSTHRARPARYRCAGEGTAAVLIPGTAAEIPHPALFGWQFSGGLVAFPFGTCLREDGCARRAAGAGPPPTETKACAAYESGFVGGFPMAPAMASVYSPAASVVGIVTFTWYSPARVGA